MLDMKSLDFVKSYTLLAQTPLIHFQSDQKGAALRATEVKPKLDRYLIACAKKEGVDIAAWKMSGEHDALDYKMRISAGNKPKDTSLNVKDCKHYFGDNDIVFKDCYLDIICLNRDLLNYIDRKIGEFFILNNFGTRQTKGFGGFEVKEKKEDIHKVISCNKNHFFYADMKGSTIKDRLNHSVCIYSIMKNGINQTRYNVEAGKYLKPKQYIKGFAVREFLNDSTGSDKAFIKSNVIKGIKRKNWSHDPQHDYTSHTFIRAVLGLADHYEFRDDMRNNGSYINKKGNLTYEKISVSMLNFAGTEIINGKPEVPIESIEKDDGIRRFRSPVTIKIFNERMYFIFDESYKEMLGKIFFVLTEKDCAKQVLESVKKEKEKKKASEYKKAQSLLRDSKYICTPDSFDVDKFINDFINYFEANKAKLRDFYFVDKNGNADMYSKTQYLTLKRGV